MRRWMGWAAGALVVFAVLMTVGYWHRGRQVHEAEMEARASALVRDSLEVEADRLERLAEVADSGRAVWEQRARQVEVERDRVDRAYRTQRRVSAALRAEVRELDAEVGARVRESPFDPDIRLVETVVRDPPWTVEIAGEVGRDTAALAVAVRVDPVEIGVAVRCGVTGPEGVRPAHVTVEGPEWLVVESVVGDVDPEACNPEPAAPPSFVERVKIGAPYLGVGVLMGAVGALLMAL